MLPDGNPRIRTFRIFKVENLHQTVCFLFFCVKGLHSGPEGLLDVASLSGCVTQRFEANKYANLKKSVPVIAIIHMKNYDFQIQIPLIQLW